MTLGDGFRDSKGRSSVRAEYTTRDGEQEYESLGWMSGNTVQYTIPSGVQIQALRYRETGFDTDFSGSLSSNDSNLNTLWTKALRTLYIDMRDNYMDCPTRERAQWWGDAVIEIGQTFYALDRRADLLTRKAISDLTLWQNTDGTLYSPVPEGNWSSELPQQILASIGRAGFWNYYFHTADDAAMSAAYPAVKKYLGLWQRSSDGLVQHRGSDPSWATWADWETTSTARCWRTSGTTWRWTGPRAWRTSLAKPLTPPPIAAG